MKNVTQLSLYVPIICTIEYYINIFVIFFLQNTIVNYKTPRKKI